MREWERASTPRGLVDGLYHRHKQVLYFPNVLRAHTHAGPCVYRHYAVPESQLLSLICDSDTASISSTASGRKRRLWHHSSTMSTSSPKQQRSTALPNVFVASVANVRYSSSSPAAVMAYHSCHSAG
jgi:hypothetical protein